MRLLLLTCLTMIAFASNSVLNRMALEGGETGPAGFAALRLISGALMLAALVWWRNRPALDGRIGPWGPASLALYMLGFSFAYVTLDAGVGALILFGGVQVTMFGGAVLAREPIPPLRWMGAVLAFCGLIFLMWPGGGGAAPDPFGAGLMGLAAFGWGIYSLIGRGARDPLRTTAVSFVVAAPAGLLAWLVVQDGITAPGAALALISGMVTSGLGYALWYTVLPGLPAAVAAIAQLTVPVIAMAGGMVFLSEALTGRFVAAAALVLGGVALGVLAGRRQRTITSSGS